MFIKYPEYFMIIWTFCKHSSTIPGYTELLEYKWNILGISSVYWVNDLKCMPEKFFFIRLLNLFPEVHLYSFMQLWARTDSILYV